MKYKIIAAKEINGRVVYLDFNRRRASAQPCWLYSHPHEFTDNTELQEEITNIKIDFAARDGYYYNSRIVPETLEIQTIGILDTLSISIEDKQRFIDRKKAIEIIDSFDLSLEDLELVIKMAKGN